MVSRAPAAQDARADAIGFRWSSLIPTSWSRQEYQANEVADDRDRRQVRRDEASPTRHGLRIPSQRG